MKQGEWLWAYLSNKNDADTKLTLAVRSMGHGRGVSKGDLDETDYWRRTEAANPMVEVLSQCCQCGEGVSGYL